MKAGLGSVALSLAAATLAARVVGFGRSLVFSKTLGDTCLGDAYNAANSLPNVLFEIVAGGVLAGVVIPVVARHVGGGRTREVSQTVSALFTWTLLVLTPAGVLAFLAAGTYGRLYASTCADNAATITALLVMFAPQLWFYGLAVVSAGVLQAHQRFLAAALAPLVSSLVVISAYLVFAGLGGGNAVGGVSTVGGSGAVLVLGFGTTAGVVVLALTTLIPLSKLGVSIRPRLRFAPGDRQVVGRIALAGIAGLILQQLSVLLISYATQQTGDPGALTRWTYANAIYLLPYAVLAAPILQLVFPRLAAAAESDTGVRGGKPGDDQAAGHSRSVRRVVTEFAPVVMIAACLGAALLVATAIPVARVFVLGVGSGRTAALAWPIAALAPAVIGFSLLGLSTRTLLAQHRARDAGLTTVAAWSVVIVGVLTFGSSVASIAVATSVGLLVGGLLGWILVCRSLQLQVGSLTRSTLAGLLAAGSAGSAGGGIAWWFGDAALLAAGGGALAAALVASLVFLIVLQLVQPQLVAALRARLRFLPRRTETGRS